MSLTYFSDLIKHDFLLFLVAAHVFSNTMCNYTGTVAVRLRTGCTENLSWSD